MLVVADTNHYIMHTSSSPQTFRINRKNVQKTRGARRGRRRKGEHHSGIPAQRYKYQSHMPSLRWLSRMLFCCSSLWWAPTIVVSQTPTQEPTASTVACGMVGTVASSQKISNSEGNLPFELGNQYEFGNAIATIGDLNQDGVVDLAVGCFKYTKGTSAHQGAIYILFMTALGLVSSGQEISSLFGGFPVQLEAEDYFGELEAEDYFGASVAYLGDFNGDGTTVIAVGAHGDDDKYDGAGAVYLLFLSANGTVTSKRKISNSHGNLPFTLATKDYFGHSVGSLGDVNADGVTDLAVGAFADDDGGTNAGAVYLLILTATGGVNTFQKVSNSDGALPYTLEPNCLFGVSLAVLKPLAEGQGTAVVVGSNDNADKFGAVFVLTASLSGITAAQKISNSEGNFPFTLEALDYFGTSVAALGDLNYDGVNDIAVGAVGDGDGGSGSGAAYLLLLNENGTVASGFKLSNSHGNLPFQLNSDSSYFGNAIASLGDLDDDGITELAISARFDDDGAQGAGAVYILYLTDLCPTPAPSPIPTILPSPAPTQIPTPAPSRYTEIAIIPETVSISAAKPQNASASSFVVNLNGDINEAMRATVRLLDSSIPGSDERVSIAPEHFMVARGMYEQMTVTVSTRGVLPDDYNMTFLITARAHDSFPINRTLHVVVGIGASADIRKSIVAVTGTPTIDTPWRGVEIRPVDADGFGITKYQEGDGFAMSLQSGDLVAACVVFWSGSFYVGDCTVPDTSVAGDWDLEVTLNGANVYSTTVHVRCGKGDYEDLGDGACYPCPTGTSQCLPGTTLESLPLSPGHWRSGASGACSGAQGNARSLTRSVFLHPEGLTSPKVRECKSSMACAGSTNVSRCTQHADVKSTANYCACGYVGPLCSECDVQWFLSWTGVEQECKECTAGGSWLPSIIAGVTVVACIALVGYLFVKSKLKAVLVRYYKVGKTKGLIIVQACQIISQFTSISQGTGDGRTYAEPAVTFSRFLSLSNFDLLTFMPLGCSIPRSTFYTSLLLKSTALPLGPVALLWIWATLMTKPGKRDGAKKTAAKLSLLWVEMVLPSGKCTYICIPACRRYLHAAERARCTAQNPPPNVFERK